MLAAPQTLDNTPELASGYSIYPSDTTALGGLACVCRALVGVIAAATTLNCYNSLPTRAPQPAITVFYVDCLHVFVFFFTFAVGSRLGVPAPVPILVCTVARLFVFTEQIYTDFFLLKAKCSLKYRIIGWLLAWAYRVRLRGMLRMSCKVHRLVVGQRSRFRFHSETEITANFPKWNPTAFHVSSNSIRSTFRVRFSRWLVPLLIQVDCIYRDFQSSVAQVHGRRHANTRPSNTTRGVAKREERDQRRYGWTRTPTVT